MKTYKGKQAWGSKCPHKIKQKDMPGLSNPRGIVVVGSWVCHEKCPHNISCTPSGDVVECGHPENDPKPLVELIF